MIFYWHLFYTNQKYPILRDSLEEPSNKISVKAKIGFKLYGL